MRTKPLQPLNAHGPIVVTLLGIVMPVKPLQSLNALFPMLVNAEDNLILVIPVPEYADVPILTIFSVSLLFIEVILEQFSNA